MQRDNASVTLTRTTLRPLPTDGLIGTFLGFVDSLYTIKCRGAAALRPYPGRRWGYLIFGSQSLVSWPFPYERWTNAL